MTENPEAENTDNTGQVDQADDNVDDIGIDSSEMPDLSPETAVETDSQDLNFFMDVPMGLNAQLGGSVMTINDILNLTAGSVIELDTVAGGNAKLFVNKKLFALGEVVISDTHLAVRITEFVGQAMRDQTKY